MQKGKNAYRMTIKGVFLLVSFLLLFPTSAFLQGEKRMEELISDLQDEKSLVRWQAAEQLGRAKDARAVEPLIEALRDGDEGVRREVIKALGEIGSSRAGKKPSPSRPALRAAALLCPPTMMGTVPRVGRGRQ